MKERYHAGGIDMHFRRKQQTRDAPFPARDFYQLLSLNPYQITTSRAPGLQLRTLPHDNGVNGIYIPLSNINTSDDECVSLDRIVRINSFKSSLGTGTVTGVILE